MTLQCSIGCSSPCPAILPPCCSPLCTDSSHQYGELVLRRADVGINLLTRYKFLFFRSNKYFYRVKNLNGIRNILRDCAISIAVDSFGIFLKIYSYTFSKVYYYLQVHKKRCNAKIVQTILSTCFKAEKMIRCGKKTPGINMLVVISVI